MVERASKQSLRARRLLYARICVYTTCSVAAALYLWHLASWYQLNIRHWDAADAQIKRPLVYAQIGTTKLYALPTDYHDAANPWTLTNKTHPIQPVEYAPRDLVALPIAAQPLLVGEQSRVRHVVAHALRELDSAAKRDGVQLMVNSAYRSYGTQQQLLAETASGLYDSGTRTAPAGASEHQLGLAIDFSTDTPSCRTGASCGISDSDAQWLATHAHTYGFILRYPEGREATTGYEYEPWHYRYVGRGLANILYTQHMVLEDAWPALEQARNQLIQRGDLATS